MVSVWLKSCCYVSTVTIALVFNIFVGIFLWVVAFFTYKFLISFSISDWETSVNGNLFTWKILSLIIRKLEWVLNFSIALGTGSFYQRFCLWYKCFQQYLTPFRIGIFGAAHGRGGRAKRPSKICHTYPTVAKLGKVMLYLHLRRSKKQINHDTHLFS